MSKIIRFVPNGKNRTPDVVKALLYAEEDTSVVFEHGTYDFYADGAYKGYFFPGCNRNGDKQVIFPLLHKNGITVEGNGSEFIFHDRVFPFIAQDCKGVTLRNFSVDFSFPRCLEGVVTTVDASGFTLEMDMEAYGCQVNAYGNLLIPAGNEMFSSSERRYFLEQRDWHCFLSVGDIYYEHHNPPAPVVYCDAELCEHGVYFRYRPDSEKVQFTVGKRLMISYDELRENDVVFLERCKNTEIEDVRIFHAAGMGIVGQCCENLHLNRYTVDPGDDGLSATTADAILLTNFSGHVCIENSLVDRSVDDAISIHGFYTRVNAITDRCKVTVRMMHLSQAGTNPYFPGDVLVVSDGETMSRKGTVTVKRTFIRDDPALIYLETEEPVKDLLRPGDILENPGRTPTVEIKNNDFKNFPAIRLSSARKMVFENNRVESCTALLVNDLIRYWSVSGCVTDLTIQNNLFANMGTGISVISERSAGSDVRHQKIHILHNTFQDCGVGIAASCVDGLIIDGNHFVNVKTPITVSDCTETEIQPFDV